MWRQEHSADSPSAMYRFSVILWLNKPNNSYTVSSLIGLLLIPSNISSIGGNKTANRFYVHPVVYVSIDILTSYAATTNSLLYP